MSQQSLDYFINCDNNKHFSYLYQARIDINLKLSCKKKKQIYSFFIIDDYIIKKNKGKKTEGIGYNYCHEEKKARRSQCVVSSSLILNDFFVPFKHNFYVGEKYILPEKFKTKIDIACELLSQFNNLSNEKDLSKSILLIDGFYTNEKVITEVLSKNRFTGFIGRFNKGRNITTKNYHGLLKKYINSLDIKSDFKPATVQGKEKHLHEVMIDLDYGTFKMVIVLDDYNDIKSARPLITNMHNLSAVEAAEYYSLRWKEETYHQVIKDAFFTRTHKFRKLRTLGRFLELINVAYGLCEQRKWSIHKNSITIFGVKNELISIAKKCFILNIKGNKIKKSKQDAVLKKFKP